MLSMPRWVDLIRSCAKLHCICQHIVYLWRFKCSWLTEAMLVLLTKTCLLTTLSAEGMRREWNYILGLVPGGNCCNILKRRNDGSVTEQRPQSDLLGLLSFWLWAIPCLQNSCWCPIWICVEMDGRVKLSDPISSHLHHFQCWMCSEGLEAPLVKL